MFSLSEADLGKRILGCGDGPASFNAELTKRGGNIISVDPLYAYGEAAIRGRIDDAFEEVMRQTRANKEEFIWSQIPCVERLGQIRMAAMQDFLSEYPHGKPEGRYLAGSLPHLDLADDSFDFALCSHFLFLYSTQLGLDFHIEAITELCRVSREVRIFPLLQLGSTPSPRVQPVVQWLQTAGYEVDRIQVPYEFQRGGNEMLRIRVHN